MSLHCQNSSCKIDVFRSQSSISLFMLRGDILTQNCPSELYIPGTPFSQPFEGFKHTLCMVKKLSEYVIIISIIIIPIIIILMAEGHMAVCAINISITAVYTTVHSISVHCTMGTIQCLAVHNYMLYTVKCTSSELCTQCSKHNLAKCTVERVNIAMLCRSPPTPPSWSKYSQYPSLLPLNAICQKSSTSSSSSSL